MGRFCPKCGRELEEGMICPCEQETMQEVAAEAEVQQEAVAGTPEDAAPQEVVAQAPVVPVQQNAAVAEIKSAALNVWGLFKEFIKKPVSVGAEFVNGCNTKLAYIVIAIHSVLVGLLAMSMAGDYNGVLKRTVGAYGEYGAEAMRYMKGVMCSLPKVFIISTITAFGIACLLAAVLLMFVKVFKGNTSFNYMLCVSAVNSLAITPFVLVGFLLSLIMGGGDIGAITGAIAAPIVIASLGIILGGYIMTKVIPAGSEISDDAIPYVMFVTELVMAIAFYVIVMMIAGPMCLPEQIRYALNNSGDIIDSLENMF